MVSEHYTHPDPAVRELIARHVAAALNGAAGEIDLLAQNKYHRFGAAHGDEVDRTFIVAYQRAARIVRNLTPP